MEEIARQIAEHFHLETKSWDWLASCLALVSIIIAFISFFIAIATLISQRHTERNTLPTITKDIQKFLFKEMIISILDGYMRLTALKIIMEESANTHYPSEEYLEGIMINTNDIHIDLFYKDISNYWKIHGFLDLLHTYNRHINTTNSHLKEKSIPADYCLQNLDNLLSLNQMLAHAWHQVTMLVFNCPQEDIEEIFTRVCQRATFEQEDVTAYYDNDNTYASICRADEQKEKLLHYMNTHTQSLISDCKAIMISK